MVFRIPTTSQQVVVIGKNGSGKTQAGAFILSQMPFDRQPFVIFDYKREALFREISARSLAVEPVDLRALNQPGIFIVRPTVADTNEVEAMLWAIWEHENIGVYIDEGYMIGKSKAYEALLTQGRSKNIPIITLTQRPTWISRFAFSEAHYFMLFRLNDRRDRETVQAFIDADVSKRLPPYFSYWYDADDETLVRLRPVPSRETIIGTINAKLAALEQQRPAKQII